MAYLYRAIDSNGDTVEFWFSERRNLTAAKRFLRKALERHGRPERIVIDGSQTNREAILSCDTADRLQDRSRRQLKPIRIRQSAYLNNRIEQDHRAIKRRVRPMLGFKSMASAQAILGGIEMVHMMRKAAGEVCLQSAAFTRQSNSSCSLHNVEQPLLLSLQLQSRFATEPTVSAPSLPMRLCGCFVVCRFAGTGALAKLCSMSLRASVSVIWFAAATSLIIRSRAPSKICRSL